MKLIGAAVCAAAMSGVVLGAQSQETTTKTKISVKDGKEVTVTGCVQPSSSNTGYLLTNVTGASGEMRSYMLVTDEVDLSKHLGHRVQITGKATDRGDGKVKTETKTKIKVDGDDKESKSKTEVKGDLPGLPFLGVKSLKMVATTCP